MKTKNRVRITRAEIEKARKEIMKSPPIEQCSKPKVSEKKYKNFWYGMVYCDHQGLAVIATGKDNAMILGRTEEVIKILKEDRIDKEDPLAIIIAVQQYRAEKQSPSCHLASGKTLGGITTSPHKSNRATSNNPQFNRLLRSLVAQGKGVPTIQRELMARGYPVKYRTLGRYVQKIRTVKKNKQKT